jgi:hypothetical protein
MTRRTLTVVACAGALTLAAACASTPQRRMHRALDASMERVLRTEAYLRSVAGITGQPSRLARGDGFIYVSDVAPVMRYLAETRDTVRYRALRSFLTEKLMRRGPSGFELARRYREGDAWEGATAYGYRWATQALSEGWRLLADTTSARVLAQAAPFEARAAQNPSEMYRLSMDCSDAVEIVASDPAPARAVMARARKLVGSRKAAEEQAALGYTAVEGEVDLLSCLTRVALSLEDPDATVWGLDHLLDHIKPMLVHSGRPDLGTAADILLTLRRVREAGPEYAR